MAGPAAPLANAVRRRYLWRMCNRMSQTADPAALAAAFGAAPAEAGGLRVYPHSDNIHPTQTVALVARGQDGGRRLLAAHWGILGGDGQAIQHTTNATKERLLESRLWSGMFARGHRCLVLFDAFYEWTGSRSPKQPWTIRVTGNRAYAFAGLWRAHRPTVERPDLATPPPARIGAAIITLPAHGNDAIGAIHHRMPAILDEDAFPAWLGETPATERELLDLLRPWPAERIEVTRGAPFEKAPALL